MANDLEGKQHHVKIVSCESYDHVKECYQQITTLQKEKNLLKLVKIEDFFEVFDEESWLLVIVSEFIDCLSLDEFVGIIRNENVYHQIPKETAIFMYLYLLDIINSAQSLKLNLKSIFPDTILLVRESPTNPAIIHTNDFSYNLRISISGKHSLRCGKSKLDNIYPSSEATDKFKGVL